MSLLAHQSEQDESSRTRRFGLISLIVIGCGVAAYFSMPPVEEPALRPALEEDPEPAAPTRVTEPDPEVATEAAPPSPAPPPAARLEPILRVESDVPEAAVFLDRAYLGTTPFETIEVPPGPHRLIVSAEGHDGFARDIEIGDTPVLIDVRFLEIRLDVSVVVVHKHRFGSCEGVLYATLDGIHYETTDDAFSIPLSEIDRHEIDYLEHTLTLARRAGRTYNFTDEQDTADALFVFHRDVEQARKRLAVRPENPQ